MNKLLRYLFLAVFAAVAAFAQPKFIYWQGDLVITLENLDSTVIFERGSASSKNVYVNAFPNVQFPVGAKVHFIALTDATINVIAVGGATLISAGDAFKVSSFGSQWTLTHLGVNIWVASGNLISTKIDAYLNDEIALRARVDLKATGPFTFVWAKNGQVISGATKATLKLSNLQYSDSGYYSVTVSNIAGTLSSEITELLVR